MLEMAWRLVGIAAVAAASKIRKIMIFLFSQTLHSLYPTPHRHCRSVHF